LFVDVLCVDVEVIRKVVWMKWFRWVEVEGCWLSRCRLSSVELCGWTGVVIFFPYFGCSDGSRIDIWIVFKAVKLSSRVVFHRGGLGKFCGVVWVIVSIWVACFVWFFLGLADVMFLEL